ncbi:MAG: CHAT domain-containing protein [Micropruina sp.]|uniref:CHAT domain-containing protein n=1 Tax=Micropruina sp. TaxID=2737536 RepID=UPI0039E61744
MDPVVVLDATMTLAAARAALDLVGPTEMVVVRRRDPRATGAILWYPLEEWDRERVMAPGLDPEMPLGESLDLHEHGASEVRQLTDPEVAGGQWSGLVVDGGRAVGWMVSNPQAGPTRGVDFDVESHVSRMAPPAAPPPAAAPLTPAPLAAPTVEAYPRVDVPEAVAPKTAFPVVVGLAKEAQLGVQGAIMNLPRDPATSHLTVQIKAESFTVDQVRQDLPFDPDDVTANLVTFHLTAPDVSRPWQGRIEVEYSFNGLLVGTAWRELLVTPDAPAEAPTSTSGGEVAVNLDQSVPIDLTVSISRGEDDSTFLWSFVSHHPVELPNEQVITRIEGKTAESFALHTIREMAQVDGSETAELKLDGIATQIADNMGPPFWPLLAEVWRIAKDAGRLPTVLLVSQESLVPWELAATDDEYIVDRSLVDPTAPQLLGAQVIVGRWRPAGPETPSKVRRPSATPVESMTVKGLAVVVGEFGPSSGMKSLKEAKEEGVALTDTYKPSVWVKAIDSEVAMLLKGTLTDRGEPVDAQVLHVASHGEVDPDSPVNSGVVLSNSSIRIDESIVIGSNFTKAAKPLVFLNCCQLATQSGGALIEGGLAAAFLRAGASAFIAPLWNVNDTIAKDTALAFYDETMVKGRPVGDVMRELRARFTTAFPKHDQTTPLAYAYYGHPGLILSRQETT